MTESICLLGLKQISSKNNELYKWMNNSKTGPYRSLFSGKIDQILLGQRIGQTAQGPLEPSSTTKDSRYPKSKEKLLKLLPISFLENTFDLEKK